MFSFMGIGNVHKVFRNFFATQGWLTTALLWQIVLMGGTLGVSVLLDMAGVSIPESNIQRHLKDLPVLSVVTALVIAPVVESLLIMGAYAIVRQRLAAAPSIMAVAASFSLLHDVPHPAAYLILFWPGMVFCTMNEIGMRRCVPAKRRWGWLAASHAVHNGFMLAISLLSSRS